ncbi:glycerophosphoryl diester phosphodiesterase [Brevibacterium sanguinis]|uniref:Glycerophosphoryl diester phosphodiesterase n=2 Tax=Brevibacterium TaxID=1696 RepID=A0A366IEE6_9MICO|nr:MULTISPECIES: glycerophosphodiester phosphodiesterase family protein [Brevibacterium]RBP62897.1 glycerophosphoryl diester phosphodiesterase [Brevibacterium sanguinis]RBP69558.1 glycerophosphoryl diester phosphodiesterase [Brevibacterium celere]
MPITLLTQSVPDAPQRGDLHTSASVHTRVPPLVIAHRGASARFPENTMPAFSAGVEQGADMIEIDLHMSRDGELIVIHDDTLERTTDARTRFPGREDYRIASFTSEEIAVLDAGGWKCPSFAGTAVPHLAEVLALVHSTRTGLLLEVKHPHQYPGIAEAIVREFESAPGYLERALAAGLLVVQSADWGFIRDLHVLAPEIPVGLLGRPGLDELRGFAGWVDQINPERREADALFLHAVHELGMSSLVWTVDEAADMERAIDLGADGIITNVPDRLVGMIADF